MQKGEIDGQRRVRYGSVIVRNEFLSKVVGLREERGQQ